MRVRVTGIKQYKDRHGKWRRYYRRKGAPSIPISMDLKGQALAAEIARLDAQYRPLAPVAGTLDLLISDYQKKSEHWHGLRDRTQQDYERVFGWMGKSKQFALTNITPPAIAALRDKARDQHGFKFANQMITTLRMVFAHGVQYGHMQSNPTRDIPKARRPDNLPDANRPWTPKEAVELMKGLPVHIAAPAAVAAYLGLRRGDVVKLSIGALQDERICFTTSKTRRSLELPVCEDLKAVLVRYFGWRAELFGRKDQPDRVLTLFVNSRGKPWTDDGFETSFGKARDDLLEKGKVEGGITFHGARHGVSTVLAEAGFDDRQVKHLLGHGQETMTEHYQRRAKRRKLLLEMTEAVQLAYREAGSNVVELDRIGNGSV